MNKIPNEINDDVFKGKQLNSISFGINYILFSFEGVVLQISGSFSLSYADSIFNIKEVYRLKDDCGLIPLIGQKVTDIHIDPDRVKLLLCFGSEYTLSMESSEAFESFEIQWQNQRYII